MRVFTCILLLVTLLAAAFLGYTVKLGGIQWNKKWSIFTRIGMSLADLLHMIWIINVSFAEEAAT